jgi:imidazolonepropionase-like amidohydrolase
MMAGSDDPNPLMVPGFALHAELRALREAGLPAREVLAMATVRPAEFMQTPEEFGVVRAGARADLVLLRGNPLEDLDVLRLPEGVMARGRWYPRLELERMLQEVATQYR